ncbi:MAG: hypothetical protein HN576_06420 [Bacteriovoracaceae bacterium]|jgi:hypothetical protein|nr:hypothetical protein [Bacteriovoracaceae bacterium]
MKRMQQLLLVFIFSLLFAVTSYAAGAGKLIDFLVNDTGIIELLGSKGIKGAAATRAKKYVMLSLSSLNMMGDRVPTKIELKKIITSISGSADDLKIKKQLTELLDRPSEQLSKKDVVSAMNNLIWLANRHGKRGAIVLACSACVSESLSRHGFKFTLEVLNDSAAKRVLNDVLPRRPRDLRNFLNEKMTSLGLGDFSRATRDLIAPEEERSLGLFLGLYEHGSKSQKELIESILEVSKRPDGKVELLDPKNPHKLWKLFTEDLDQDELVDWSKMLKKVARDSSSDESKKDAFFAYLKRRAGDDPTMNEWLNKIKIKKCFFN